MILFFSRNNRPRTIVAFAGNGIEPVFEERIVDGVKCLVRTGGNPINPFVQEGVSDTLVYNVIDRYMRGDVDALHRMSAQFMDVTSMPTSLAEAQQRLIDVERKFSMFPATIRAKFDNSVHKFMEECSTGNVQKVFESLGFVTVPSRPSVEELSKVKEVNKGDVTE